MSALALFAVLEIPAATSGNAGEVLGSVLAAILIAALRAYALVTAVGATVGGSLGTVVVAVVGATWARVLVIDVVCVAVGIGSAFAALFAWDALS